MALTNMRRNGRSMNPSDAAQASRQMEDDLNKGQAAIDATPIPQDAASRRQNGGSSDDAYNVTHRPFIPFNGESR